MSRGGLCQAADDPRPSTGEPPLESRFDQPGRRVGLAADERVKIDAALALGDRTFAGGEVVAKGTAELTGGPGKRLVELQAPGPHRQRSCGQQTGKLLGGSPYGAARDAA